MKLTLDEWINEFDSRTKTVKVDWDGGHCYSYLEGHSSPDECKDVESAQSYSDDYLYNNEPTMFCNPEGGCGCYDSCFSTEEKIEHIEGFISLATEMDCKMLITPTLNDELNKLKLISLKNKLS